MSLLCLLPIRLFHHLMAIARVVVVLFLGLGVLQANAESGNVMPHWVGHVYVWRYNPANEPVWLNEGEALEMIHEAAVKWEACVIPA